MEEFEKFDHKFAYLHNLPLGVCITKKNYNIRFWNQTLQKWTNKSGTDVFKTSLLEIYPHLRERRYQDRIEGVIQGGPSVIFSSQFHPHFLPLELSDGQLRILHTTVSSVASGGNEGPYIMFSIQDVTQTVRHIDRIKKLRKEALEQINEREKAEEALKASEIKYRSLFQNLPIGVFHFTREGEISTVNSAIQDILNLPEKKLIGLKLRDFPFNKIDQAYQEVLEGDKFHYEGEYRTNKSGKKLHFKADFAPVLTENGDVAGGVGIVEDISKRIKTLKELEERENQYRLMVEASEQVFFFMHNRKHRFTYLSPSVEQVTGFRQSELLGKSYEVLLYDNDSLNENVRELTEKSLQTGRRNDAYTISIRHKNESKIYLEIVESPLHNGEEITSIQGFARDITSRIKAEQELLESKEMIDSINRNIREGIFRFKPGEGLKYANQGLAKMFRLPTVEQLKEKTSPNFLQEHYQLKEMLEELKYQKTIVNREVYFRRNDQSGLWALMSLTSVRDEEGKLKFLDGALTDITQRKEDELIRSALYKIAEHTSTLDDIEAYYEQIHQIVSELMMAENFFVAIGNPSDKMLHFPYCKDEHGKVRDKIKSVYSNGITEYIIGNKAPVLLSEKDVYEMRDNGDIDLIGEVPQSLLGVPILSASGVLGAIVVQVYDSSYHYTQRDSDVLTFVAQHVATAVERYRNQQNLLRSKEEAEIANKAKSIFLANISHELRTPLNSIIGFSRRILNQSRDELPDTILEAVQIVQRNARNLLNLINDILDFSKLEAGKMNYTIRRANINDICSQTLEELEPLATSKNLNLSLVDSKKIFAKVDTKRLKQVLLNIVGNAIKFTNDGYVKIKLNHTKKNRSNFVEIRVEDTGVGIPGDKLETIFDVFEQADHGEGSDKTGTGLGLAISRRIIDNMNGKIEVTSEVGKGTEFCILLPATEES